MKMESAESADDGQMGTNKSAGLKFAFTAKASVIENRKKLETRSILASKDDEKVDEEETKERITAIEDRKIEGGKPRKTGPLVIPMITNNEWLAEFKVKNELQTDKEVLDLTYSEKSDEKTASSKGDLYEAAKRALLEEAQSPAVNDVGSSSGVVVPLLLQNQVPAGYESEDRLDVSLRPTMSLEADYDQVPIEEYGMAMLRGMGWKDGEPIGKTNKQSVVAKIPELRPKGLGLGADRSLAAQLKKGNGGGSKGSDEQTKFATKKTDELTAKIGGFVKIISGPNRECYGKIESFDEDNCRLMVRLALGGNMVTVSQYAMIVVSAMDYERDAKVINKSKYDQYKAQQASETTQVGDGRTNSSGRDPLGVETIDILDDDSTNSSQYRREKRKKKKKRRSESPTVPKTKKWKRRDSSEPEEVVPWVRADLRVRIIDKLFKGGRYYKQKVRVVDVVGGEQCSCRTDDGKLIEGLSQHQLETVIPKTIADETTGDTGSYVMVVLGKWRGEVAKVLARDSGRSEATVQLVRRDDAVTRCSYDGICQFDGDLTLYLD